MKELVRSFVVHTFFDQTGNTADETVTKFEPIYYSLFRKRMP